MKVLITGADGYLGLRLARRFIAAGTPVLLWVRARDEGEFQQKANRLRGDLPGASFAWGDLGQSEPFGRVDPGEIGQIVHAAAVTRFNVDSETADRVNVAGTRKIVEFAERCPRLECFGYLSTVYASGLTAGPIEERPFDARPEFANHYERSKFEAERTLIQRDLPWRIFRIATVIADDDSGTVTQQNALHNSLKLLYYGLLSLIPGEPRTPVYLVTGKFAVDTIQGLMNHAADRAIYHVAHTRAESLTLGGLIDAAYEVFGQTDDFRARRILRPIFADSESFDLLNQGLQGFGGEVLGQAVSSLIPFAPQLYVTKEIRNDTMTGAVAKYAAPNADELIRRTTRYLIRTRWGRSHA